MPSIKRWTSSSEAPSRFGPNRPLYKPEHWDKVQQLDMWTNKEGRKQRQGNQIKFEVTVEDPEVLVEPWVMTPKILRLNANRRRSPAGAWPLRGLRAERHHVADSALARRAALAPPLLDAMKWACSEIAAGPFFLSDP